MNTAEFLMASPQNRALTPQEAKELRNSKVLILVAAVLGVLCIGIEIEAHLPQIINNLTAPSPSLGVWVGILLILGGIGVTGYICSSYIIEYLQDQKNGIKHVGIATVTFKSYVPGNSDTASSYYVHLRWCGCKQTGEQVLDDYEMYKQLQEGDKVYLEIAPHSKHVFTFRKK
ncbi:MAG: hypothetical protein ACK4GN_04765 [Runella sp.]